MAAGAGCFFGEQRFAFDEEEVAICAASRGSMNLVLVSSLCIASFIRCSYSNAALLRPVFSDALNIRLFFGGDGFGGKEGCKEVHGGANRCRVMQGGEIEII